MSVLVHGRVSNWFANLYTTFKTFKSKFLLTVTPFITGSVVRTMIPTHKIFIRERISFLATK